MYKIFTILIIFTLEQVVLDEALKTEDARQDDDDQPTNRLYRIYQTHFDPKYPLPNTYYHVENQPRNRLKRPYVASLRRQETKAAKNLARRHNIPEKAKRQECRKTGDLCGDGCCVPNCWCYYRHCYCSEPNEPMYKKRENLWRLLKREDTEYY